MLLAMKHLPQDAVYTQMDSPVGKLTLIASNQGLHAVLFDQDCKLLAACKTALFKLAHSDTHKILNQTKRELREYFDKKRKTFDIPLALEGTPFQVKVWKELLNIPYGETIAYGEQARRLGDSKKARAVGVANSKNPISIIVPCHRVIGKSGQLVGYGGGLSRKEYLLGLEK